VSGFSNGTTVQMLPVEALLRPTFALPPMEVVQRFTAVASMLRRRQRARRSESAHLAAICDALVPRLLSGELKVAA
jgi:type I restriction enzyme S subunit